MAQIGRDFRSGDFPFLSNERLGREFVLCFVFWVLGWNLNSFCVLCFGLWVGTDNDNDHDNEFVLCFVFWGLGWNLNSFCVLCFGLWVVTDNENDNDNDTFSFVLATSAFLFRVQKLTSAVGQVPESCCIRGAAR